MRSAVDEPVCLARAQRLPGAVRARWSLPGVLAAAAIVLFVALASWRIHLPGLQYDEVLFVQAAIGAPNGLFVHTALGDVPLMTMSYLGALKAWIFAPIFALFGVSPLTIRLPAVLLAALALVVLYRLLRREAGPAAACLAVWMTALDTAYVFHSRLDWGPVVLATLFQVAVLWCVLRFVRQPSWRTAAGGVLFALLGLWNKLNFAWFLGGLGVAVLVCYPGPWLGLARKLRPAVRWPVVAASVAVAAVLVVAGWRHGELSAEAFSPERFRLVGMNTLHTFSGTLLTSFLLNHPLGFPAFSRDIAAGQVLAANPLWFSAWPWALLLALTPVALLGARLCPRQGQGRIPELRLALFFLLVLAGTFLMIVATPDAGHMHQSHHLMLLHPFHIFLVALAFQALLVLRASRVGLALLSAFGGAALLVLTTSAANTVAALRYVGRGERVDLRWSPAIYDLVRVLDETASGVDRVISVDWGTHNQLLALGSPALRERLDDLWLQLKYLHRNPDDEARLVASLRGHRRTLAVCYHEGDEVQKHARPAFFRLLKREGIPCRLLTQVERQGIVVYEVYEVLGTGAVTP
jgi:4-amino-4-deoxy-L-arabinose transferase-like glycosyltransferase